MDIKNIKLNNDNKMSKKYYKTESIPKAKDLLSITSQCIDNLHLLSYKLYKLYEKSRKDGKNNSHFCNKKDLFSNILVKNYNKEQYVKNLNELNINIESTSSNTVNTNTINNFYSRTVSGTSSTKIFRNNQRNNSNSFKRIYFLPKMTLNNFKKMNNFLIPDDTKKEKEKINLCLVPLFKTIWNSRGQSKKREKNKPLNIKTLYNNNDNNIIINKIKASFSKKNFRKKLEKKKKFLTIRINKTNIDSNNEENDMKPKIRFINLKKDLKEETFKINKMFDFFNKQINEQQKKIQYIGKHMNNIKEINNNNKINNDF